MALLIPCQPIQVLPGLAQAVGLNEAIFLQQLHYWLERSSHEHDGRVWVYNTFEEWQTQFPFWSLRTMQRIAASLVKRKLLLVHKFNSQNWDQKNWYSIDYEALSLLNTDHAKLAGSSMSEWRDLDHAKLAGSYKGSETTTETTNTPPISPKGLVQPESLEPPFSGKDFLAAVAAYDRTAKKRKVKESPDQRRQCHRKGVKAALAMRTGSAQPSDPLDHVAFASVGELFQ